LQAICSSKLSEDRISSAVSITTHSASAAYTNLSLPRLGYNAVLCNLYRNGNDSVGLHADADEMGPVIASISLGAERLFRLKEARRKGCLCGTVIPRQLVCYGGKDAEKLQA
jgi:alkylated DNA repair dioxygenase AlkB